MRVLCVFFSLVVLVAVQCVLLLRAHEVSYFLAVLGECTPLAMASEYLVVLVEDALRCSDECVEKRRQTPQRAEVSDARANCWLAFSLGEIFFRNSD